MDEDKSGIYRLKNLGILILEFPRPAEPVPELPPKLAVLCCRGTEMCGFILTVRPSKRLRNFVDVRISRAIQAANHDSAPVVHGPHPFISECQQFVLEDVA